MAELDLIPKGAKLDDVIDTLNKNTLNLGRFFGKLGVNLLSETVTGTAQTTTSTTYVKATEFQKGFNSSGGLVLILCKIPVAVPGAQTAVLQLRVDDTEKDTCRSSSAAGVLSDSILLWWFGELPEGKHTAKVYAKVDGGTLSIITSGDKGSLYVLEILKG